VTTVRVATSTVVILDEDVPGERPPLRELIVYMGKQPDRLRVEVVGFRAVDGQDRLRRVLSASGASAVAWHEPAGPVLSGGAAELTMVCGGREANTCPCSVGELCLFRWSFAACMTYARPVDMLAEFVGGVAT
jgi:hypothetical protein